jgi:hypothetical protein
MAKITYEYSSSQTLIMTGNAISVTYIDSPDLVEIYAEFGIIRYGIDETATLLSPGVIYPGQYRVVYLTKKPDLSLIGNSGAQANLIFYK